jgi:hypothetical protein
MTSGFSNRSLPACPVGRLSFFFAMIIIKV